MARDKLQTLKGNDLKRLFVIRRVLNGTLTQTEASQMLSLTTRQIRRIMKRVKTEGNKGIINKSRGKTSNHRYPDKIKDRAVKLYREKYKFLSPTLAARELLEVDNIKLHGETLRKWLIETGDWENKGKKRIHIDIIDTDKGSRTRNKEQTRKFIIEDNGVGNSPKPSKKTIKKQEKHPGQDQFIAPKKKYIPPPDHPWRKLMYPQDLAKYEQDG